MFAQHAASSKCSSTPHSRMHAGQPQAHADAGCKRLTRRGRQPCRGGTATFVWVGRMGEETVWHWPTLAASWHRHAALPLPRLPTSPCSAHPLQRGEAPHAKLLAQAASGAGKQKKGHRQFGRPPMGGAAARSTDKQHPAQAHLRCASASTLAISTRPRSLGSLAILSPSFWYSGTRRLQWPHPARGTHETRQGCGPGSDRLLPQHF